MKEMRRTLEEYYPPHLQPPIHQKQKGDSCFTHISNLLDMHPLHFATSIEGILLTAWFFGFLLLSYRLLIRALRTRRTSDLHLIPGPAVSLWKRYLLGHRFSFHVFCTNPFDFAATLNHYRKKYGPIFLLRGELGEVEVIVTSEKGIRQVTITEQFSFIKDAKSRLFLRQFLDENGIGLAEGSSHAKLRKAVSPAMHHEALIALGEAFLGEGKMLANTLAKMGAVEDILSPVRASTFSVIFKTCFGENAMSPGEIFRLQSAYDEAFLEPPWSIFASSILKSTFWFVDPSHFTWRKDLKSYIRKSVHDLCTKLTEIEKESSNEVKSSLLSLMVNEGTTQRLSSLEKAGTIMSFLLGGQLTTAFAICWTLYLLGKEEIWQQRLLKELQQWSEEDGLEPLDRLPLLDQVVKESIRMYPPALYVSRMVNKQVEVDGYRLPRGAVVHIPVGAIQRNKDIWGLDADEFNPERFLREDVLAKSKMFWCAFLFGPRSCIGRRFAILEIKAFVAQVLKRQRIYIKPWQDSAPSVRGIFATPVNMKIYFESR